MKTIRIFVFSSMTALLCPILLHSQISKYPKWQQPSYFTGFNISVWDNYDQREVNQEDFDSLKAIGANRAIIHFSLHLVRLKKDDKVSISSFMFFSNPSDIDFRIGSIID